MLKFTVNKNSCVEENVPINIKSIVLEDNELIFETETPITMQDNETIYFQRKNDNNVLYEEKKVITLIDKTHFKTSKFEDKVVTVLSCENVENLRLPYESEAVKAIKFKVDDIFTFINKNVVIKDVYADYEDAFFKHCVGDYVRYEDVFFLKSKRVENNKYIEYVGEFFNTNVELFFKSGGRLYTLNCFIPIFNDGSDNRWTLYWLYNDEDELIKEVVLKYYETLEFTCKDQRFLINEGNTFQLTKNFDGKNDSSIHFISNNLRFNVSVNSGFNTSLLKNEYYNQFFIEDEIEKNVNKIVDMEKQIFIPKVLKEENGEVTFNNGIVNEIIIKPIFRKRDKNWEDGEVLNEYYTNTSEDGTSLYDLGFTEDDIRYQKSSLKKTFIRLSFYDSRSRANQSLLFYSTIFLNSNYFFSNYINDSENVYCKFNISSSFDYSNSSEGYYLYLFPNLCKGESETIIYMKVEFNHAKYGKVIPLLLPGFEGFEKGYIGNETGTTGMTQLLNDLYIPVIIRYDSTINQYTWCFQNGDVNDYKNNKITLKLYEPIVNKSE